MVASHICLLILGVILAIAVQQGSAISCYSCNSGWKYEGKECDEEFAPEKNLVDCDTLGANYTLCRLIKQDVMGDVRIHRQCGKTGRKHLGCIDRTGTKKIKIRYCECKGDKCNTATVNYAPAAILLTLISATLAAILHL